LLSYFRLDVREWHLCRFWVQPVENFGNQPVLRAPPGSFTDVPYGPASETLLLAGVLNPCVRTSSPHHRPHETPSPTPPGVRADNRHGNRLGCGYVPGGACATAGTVCGIHPAPGARPPATPDQRPGTRFPLPRWHPRSPQNPAVPTSAASGLGTHGCVRQLPVRRHARTTGSSVSARSPTPSECNCAAHECRRCAKNS